MTPNEQTKMQTLDFAHQLTNKAYIMVTKIHDEDKIVQVIKFKGVAAESSIPRVVTLWAEDMRTKSEMLLTITIYAKNDFYIQTCDCTNIKIETYPIDT